MSNQEHTGGLSRRTLIKSSALGSLALAAGGLSLPFSLRRRRRCTRSDPRRGTDRLGRLFGQLRQSLRAAFTRSR